MLRQWHMVSQLEQIQAVDHQGGDDGDFFADDNLHVRIVLEQAPVSRPDDDARLSPLFQFPENSGAKEVVANSAAAVIHPTRESQSGIIETGQRFGYRLDDCVHQAIPEIMIE